MSEQQAEQQHPNDETQPLEGLSHLAELEGELAEARAQASQQRDLVLRAAAELDNIRKRAARDVEQAHRFALEKFVQELLPAVDSLELAVTTASRADAPSLVA
ncbi:MAG TPA: nucleotide exchange factor GrpE, partial [Steroidobacteraceae bacterium]|nr:nucleotide exchange factor GrpE [Steroidobacteraceae bacterium]